MLYNKVNAELAKPDASLQVVGELIAQDVAMTAKILQMVNPLAIGLAMPISAPAEAVVYLGAVITRCLILTAGLMLDFDKTQCRGFSHDHLWHHSMAVGGFARAMATAQTEDKKVGDMAYTAGLLHDVGKL